MRWKKEIGYGSTHRTTAHPAWLHHRRGYWTEARQASTDHLGDALARAPVDRRRRGRAGECGSVRDEARRAGGKKKRICTRNPGWPLDRFSTIGRAWEGDTVALIGGGASVTETQVAIARRVAQRIIVVNNAYQLAPDADVLYFADTQWWNWHKDDARFINFEGEKISLFGNGAGTEDADVHIVRQIGGRGISTDPAGVMTGSNGGYQALNIAVLAGAKRILLLGIDMKGKHWHPEHPAPTHEAHYLQYAVHFSEAAKILKKMGIEVLNCSPISALTCFPKVDIASLLPDPDPAALPA